MRAGERPLKSKNVHRCFMTGRTCIHEQEISKRQEDIEKKVGGDSAFVVMPFTPDLDAIYAWQIKPFLERGGDNKRQTYSCQVQRADDVWQVGFIICTKICKQIQMANLVVVDLTYNNPNVFYEFGISAALRKRILPIAMGRELDKNNRSEYLKRSFGIEGTFSSGDSSHCKVISYPDFGYMVGDISESEYNTSGLPESANGDQVLIIHESDFKIEIPNKHGYGDPPSSEYSFGKICNTATSTAIRSIFYPTNSETSTKADEIGKLTDTKRRYRDKIAKRFQGSSDELSEMDFVKNMVVEMDLSKTNFSDISKAIVQSGCVIIDIRNHDPRAFFWLGYLHAIGAHVIPVNVSPITLEGDGRQQSTMAFDIAGLWYAQFNAKEPLVFETTLCDILGYIYDEKAKQLQKDAFWQKILSDRPVSVFLGTVSEEKLGRNSLGDWDYRSAAEITSFLSQKSHKVVLENPIIKPTNPDSVRPMEEGADYLQRLRGHLTRKNCIIIGSSDINELTEVVWATIHGHKPFTSIPVEETTNSNKDDINCFIAFKQYKGLESEDKKRLFGYGSQGMSSFILEDAKENAKEKRGFIFREGNATQAEILQEFISHQSVEAGNPVLRKLYGQLIVCRNPWYSDNWIVIINGTSGPATLGITQILTGCQYKDFTMRSDAVPREVKEQMFREWSKGTPESIHQGEMPSYNELSENLLTECLKFFEGEMSGFEAMIEVGVYYPSEELLNDERKVVGWRFTNVEKKTSGVKLTNPRKRDWLFESTSE